LQEDRGGAPAQRLLELVGAGAVLVGADADGPYAEGLEQVEQGREARVLHHRPVAQAQQGRGDLVEGVHRPVEHRQPVRPVRPVVAQQGGQLGQDRLVEVAGRRGGEAGQRGQGGQQRRIRHAGGQVEGEAGAPAQGGPVAARPVGPGGGDDRTATAVGLDGAGPAQQLPGCADGSRRHAQLDGHPPDRGQPRPGREAPVAHRAADRVGQAAGGRIDEV
jgi:hypothetical protein